MKPIALVLSALALAAATTGARADAITDWSLKSADVISEAKIGTPPAADARVLAGIHFRSATDTGDALGKRIGELAVSKLLDGAQ